MNLLRELNQEGGTIILVTHDDSIAAYAKRQIFLRDGTISQEGYYAGPK
jgi:ABC-type lipoprotein export system ATPase subunit